MTLRNLPLTTLHYNDLHTQLEGVTIVTKKLKEITELSGFLSSSSPFDSVIDNNSKEVDQAAVIATAVKVGTSLCCVCLCVCVCVCMHTFSPLLPLFFFTSLCFSFIRFIFSTLHYLFYFPC